MNNLFASTQPMNNQSLNSMTTMQLTSKLTRQLIISLNIQEGHGLCYFLGVSPCYQNYLAIWRWVMGQVEALSAQTLDDYTFDQLYYDLESYFVHQLPAG